MPENQWESLTEEQKEEAASNYQKWLTQQASGSQQTGISQVTISWEAFEELRQSAVKASPERQKQTKPDLHPFYEEHIRASKTIQEAQAWRKEYEAFLKMRDALTDNRHRRGMQVGFVLSGVSATIGSAALHSLFLFFPGMFMIGIGGYFLAPEPVKEALKNLTKIGGLLK